MSLQIFISWSGDPSREVAENLSSFVRHVVRGAETFVSTQDIDAGERWEARLSEELELAHVAVLCVTRDNQGSPWLNYEAGALGKVLDKSRVVPYAIDFHPGEMKAGPLSRLQGVQNDNAGTWALVRTLNRSLAKPADEAFVREDFDLWWPRLQEKMHEALATPAQRTRDQEPSDRELLLEMRRDLQDVQQVVKQLIQRRPEPRATEVGTPLDYDELTRLPNQRAFIQRAQALYDANAKLVMACIDLDNFKQVNDLFGHDKGDEVLVWIAAELQRQLPHADLVARIGGDEFVALFSGVTPKTVAAAITQFIAQLSERMRSAGFPELTASAGVSSSEAASLDSMLREADTAMYQAKKEGRGRVVREA